VADSQCFLLKVTTKWCEFGLTALLRACMRRIVPTVKKQVGIGSNLCHAQAMQGAV